MEEKRLREVSGCRRENDERKQPYTHRDIKRKLSLIKKNVEDLQQQRKIAYKNSVKVKRMAHNQINQIVKCLRARERYLWSEIDDAYLSQDENISQELLRLQSIYTNCQTLFDHLGDNPQNAKALSKIYCTLAQVKNEEKLNSKALEFTSEFEMMKTMAEDFGNLAGDFSKKDEFVIIDKDSSSNISCEKSHNNREYFKMAVSENNIGKDDPRNEYLTVKTDLEDLFEVISFNDNASCEQSDKDFHVVNQDNFEKGCQKIENLSLSNKIGNKLKDSNKFEKSQNTLKDKDFNPEEEWKHLSELKKRVSSMCGMLPKLENESSSSGNQNATSNNLKSAKSSNEFVYLSPNEVNDWLPKKRARKDKVSNKCTWQNKFLFETRDGLQKMNSELERNKIAKSCDQLQINLCKLSPAEIVQREFSKYSVKDGIKNWLSQ